ncbi:MAG: hypothetical protein QXY62_04995, partial [Candidatus Altiarchaeota archaeon]
LSISIAKLSTGSEQTPSLSIAKLSTNKIPPSQISIAKLSTGSEQTPSLSIAKLSTNKIPPSQISIAKLATGSEKGLERKNNVVAIPTVDKSKLSLSVAKLRQENNSVTQLAFTQSLKKIEDDRKSFDTLISKSIESKKMKDKSSEKINIGSLIIPLNSEKGTTPMFAPAIKGETHNIDDYIIIKKNGKEYAMKKIVTPNGNIKVGNAEIGFSTATLKPVGGENLAKEIKILLSELVRLEEKFFKRAMNFGKELAKHRTKQKLGELGELIEQQKSIEAIRNELFSKYEELKSSYPTQKLPIEVERRILAEKSASRININMDNIDELMMMN